MGDTLDGGYAKREFDSFNDFLSVQGVGHGERQESPMTSRHDGEGGAGELAVGENYGIAIAGLQRSMAEANVLHPAGGIGGCDKITSANAVFQFESYAPRDVAQHVLQGQPKNRRGDGRGSKNARNIHAHTHQQMQQSGDVTCDNQHFVEKLWKMDAAQGEVEDQDSPDLYAGQGEEGYCNFVDDEAGGTPRQRQQRPEPGESPQQQEDCGGAQARLFLGRFPERKRQDEECGC